MKLDVDCKQRVIASSQMCLEFYKVMMGTFLVLFVPQDCGGSPCSVYDNIVSDMIMRKVTLGFNSLAFMSILALYIVEYRRELWCIENLDIDPSRPNEYLDDAIEEYPIIKQEMASYNNLYVDAFYVACGLMSLNLILSVIDILQHDIAFSTFLKPKIFKVFHAPPIEFLFSIINTFSPFLDLETDSKIAIGLEPIITTSYI
mgnify:CR=1 FL=1